MKEIFTPSNKDRYKTYEQAKKYVPEGYEIKEDEKGFYGQLIKKEEETEEVKDFEVKEVHCPFCDACNFETTQDYDPKKPAHPGMIEMIEPYKSYGWQQPPQDTTAGYGVIECCECGSPLAPEGYFKVKAKKGK